MKPKDRGPIVVRPPGSTVPIPVGKDTDIALKANMCLETVANDMYEGDDLRFMGKTNLEAAILSLAADAPKDSSARTEFLDRIMGKPKQRVDSTSVTMDLTSYLAQLAKEDDEEVHDAEFRVSNPSETGERLSVLREEKPEDQDEDGRDSSLYLE